jgi:hypothetical protein
LGSSFAECLFAPTGYYFDHLSDLVRNVLAFYSSTFFVDVNNNQMDALWLSWGLGLANFVFTFPTYYFIDKVSHHKTYMGQG